MAGTSASGAGEEPPSPVGAGRGGIGGLRRGTKALAMRGPRPTTSSTSAGAGSDDDDAKDEVVGRRQMRASGRGGGAASPMRAASASTAATSGKAPLPPVGKSWWRSIPFLPPPILSPSPILRSVRQFCGAFDRVPPIAKAAYYFPMPC